MPRPFAITTEKDSVSLNRDGTGQATFTVSNTFGQVALGRGRVVPADPVQEDWYEITDDIERTLRPDQTTEYRLRVKVPEGTPSGDYTVRFDMQLLDNRDEVLVEGPTVTVKHVAAEPKPDNGGFPWWILAVVGGVVVLAIAVVLFFVLRGGPSSVVVPDVRNVSFDQASAALSAAGLTAERGETVLRNDVAADMVVEQNPAPDTEAARKSGVLLTVSAADVVTVPDANGKLFSVAEQELTAAGLSVQRGEAVLRENTPRDIVVDQSPKANEQAPRGTVVVLSITGDSVSVPQLRGQILNDATASTIGRAGLFVEFVSQADQVQPQQEILGVAPADGTLVARGSTIKLTLARHPRMPEDSFKQSVNALLARHGLNPPRIWQLHPELLRNRAHILQGGGG